MAARRIASAALLVLVALEAPPLAACEVPPALLSGRSLSEHRRILEGEVSFVADARLHDFEGHTTAISGVVITRELEDAVGCVAIEAKTLDTGIGARNRIMWADHLEVAQFPEIQFLLTGLGDVHRDGDTVAVTLEGALALHGVTQSLRIPVTVIPADRGLLLEGMTILHMSDYAIKRPTFLFIRVKDEVNVRFRVLVGEAAPPLP